MPVKYGIGILYIAFLNNSFVFGSNCSHFGKIVIKCSVIRHDSIHSRMRSIFRKSNTYSLFLNDQIIHEHLDPYHHTHYRK